LVRAEGQNGRSAQESGTTPCSIRERVSPELIREFAAVDVAVDDLRYSGALERDVNLLTRPGSKLRS